MNVYLLSVMFTRTECESQNLDSEIQDWTLLDVLTASLNGDNCEQQLLILLKVSDDGIYGGELICELINIFAHGGTAMLKLFISDNSAKFVCLNKITRAIPNQNQNINESFSVNRIAQA